MSYHIKIYTDGASSGNPGPGGFGYILIWGNHQKQNAKGYRLTTNNRMELMAVIEALEAVKKDNCEITVISDSKYVVDAIEKNWLQNWIKTGFKGKKNADLWLRFLQACKNHKIRFEWVKGHNQNYFNELCDKLAVEASQQKNLLIDEGYENTTQNQLFTE